MSVYEQLVQNLKIDSKYTIVELCQQPKNDLAALDKARFVRYNPLDHTFTFMSSLVMSSYLLPGIKECLLDIKKREEDLKCSKSDKMYIMCVGYESDCQLGITGSVEFCEKKMKYSAQREICEEFSIDANVKELKQVTVQSLIKHNGELSRDKQIYSFTIHVNNCLPLSNAFLQKKTPLMLKQQQQQQQQQNKKLKPRRHKSGPKSKTAVYIYGSIQQIMNMLRSCNIKSNAIDTAKYINIISLSDAIDIATYVENTFEKGNSKISIFEWPLNI